MIKPNASKNISRKFKRLIIIASSIFVLILGGCTSLPDQPTFNHTRTAAIYTQLGLDYLKEDKIDLAKIKINKALRLAPNYARAHYALANYFQHFNDSTGAKAQYQQAFNLAPKNAEIANGYAIFLCSNKHYQQAQHYFSQALALKTNTSLGLTYQNAGICALDHKDYKLAKQYLTRAISHNPQLTETHAALDQATAVTNANSTI